MTDDTFKFFSLSRRRLGVSCLAVVSIHAKECRATGHSTVNATPLRFHHVVNIVLEEFRSTAIRSGTSSRVRVMELTPLINLHFFKNFLLQGTHSKRVSNNEKTNNLESILRMVSPLQTFTNCTHALDGIGTF